MKHLILIIASLLALTTTMHAQGLFSITYDLSFPTGDLSDRVGGTSWRGVTFIDGRSFISDRVSVGGTFGWHVFSDKKDGTFESGTTTGTGTLVRTVNAFPLMATAHYYFANQIEVNPYIGVGLGTSNVTTRTDFGLFSDKVSNWHFGLAPQLGVLIPLQYSTALHLKATYNLAFQSGDANFDTQYFTLGVGFAWYK